MVREQLVCDRWEIRLPRCGHPIDELTLVLAGSSMRERWAVQQFNCYFKRELRNDFMLYVAEAHDQDTEAWSAQVRARSAAD